MKYLVVSADLDVGDRRQRLLTVGVLGGESEERGDAQGHPGRDSFRLDPETDPGHHDDETGGDVGVEHEVPGATKLVFS